MKQKLTFLLLILFSFSINAQVFITELADPNNNASVRYIELYNAGSVAVDFTENTGWRIDKYTNGSATVSQTLALSGTIQAYSFYIIATGTDDGDFLSIYGVAANQFDGNDNDVAGSNGDDNLELYDGNNILLDQFGVPGEDGSGTIHEFEDGRAERLATVLVGKPIWDVLEWDIDNDGSTYPGSGIQDAPADFDPGAWIGVTSTVPVISNITILPTAPTVNDAVTVSATITDDGTIATAILNWGTTSGSLTNAINMTGLVDVYTIDTQIPAQIAATTVYYNIVATDNNSNITTSTEMSYTIPTPATPQTTTLPYAEAFSTDLGITYSYSVLGDTKEWNYDTDKATMNGYGSSETEEDWFVLPGINLDNYSNEVLTFDTERQYGSDEDADHYFELYYSTDYTGVGDPTSSTWNELTFTKPTAASTMTASGDIDLSSISGTMVYIAFKYYSITSDYRRWSIDNINIAEPSVAPGGIDCANALPIVAGTHPAMHTQDGDGSIYDQWYSFVAPSTGTATVENCASDIDIYILIQEGTCGNDYDMADEDNCGTNGMSENFTFNVTAGETYFVGIGNWMQTYIADYEWTLSFSDVTPVNSIALLRAGTVGSKYELTSEALITYQQSYRSQKFIEDATAAILIDDNDGNITTTYNLYDGITGITGTLSEYNDMLQFVPTLNSDVASTTGNTVTPQVVTLAQFTSNFEDYESELITLNDVTFTDADGTFATGTLYEMNDASAKGTANFRTNFYDADYIAGTIPTNVNVTGICIDKGTSGDGYTFTARNLADFEAIVNTDPTLTITSPAEASTITVDNVDVAFDVTNFVLGTDGEVAYSIDGGTTVGTTSTSPISFTALTDGDYTVDLELVDMSGVSLATPVNASVSFTINLPDAINYINTNSISVYPNPSNGVFTISVNDNFNVEVIDIAGKVLNTKSVYSNTTINISEAGVYFLRFSNEKGTTVKRIIVQ